MSKRRRKTSGTGGMVFLSERSGATLNEGGPKVPRPSSSPGAGRRLPANGMEVAPLDRRTSVPITPEVLGALTTEMSRFNRMLEDLFSREKSGRSPEEHKEMWVLLSALTVVVVFCFVAFYLNQSEVREMHSGLQSEIDHAGKSAASSMERALANLRLERIPESTANLETVIKEKDRRDVQRMGDLQSAIKGLAEKTGSVAREELKDIEGELKALRRISEEIQKAQAQPTAAPAEGKAAAKPAGPTEVALKSNETRSGWAARAPDGTPSQGPRGPAARPPGQTISSSSTGPPAGGGLGEPR